MTFRQTGSNGTRIEPPNNWMSFLPHCFSSQKRVKGKDRALQQRTKSDLEADAAAQEVGGLTSPLEKGSAWRSGSLVTEYIFGGCLQWHMDEG